MLCREASQDQQLQSPQQYGIWQVEGLGLVVAFRGTSSWNDVFVDINVRPTPLTCEGGKELVHVSHFTLEICQRHCQENIVPGEHIDVLLFLVGMYVQPSGSLHLVFRAKGGSMRQWKVNT